MKESYFYYEARHYQNRAKAYASEAIYFLNCYLETGSTVNYYRQLAVAYQEKAKFEANEARHYLMLAINPNHYKQLANWEGME